MSETCVVTEVRNGVGWIKLNRPRVLNSLNFEMVEILKNQLDQWKRADHIALVCIYGEGEKGLCAGGDMRAIYNLKDAGVEEYAKNFFSTEYAMDYEVHHYSKPILAYMHGIVMGGGVGLSIAATHRIVTETTRWAMPEMNIGFFPDVGSSYFLNKMPGHIGTYLALTSEVLQYNDVLNIGAGDYLLQSEHWQTLKKTIEEQTWFPETASIELDSLLKGCSKLPSGTLTLQHDKIDRHFSFDTIEKMISSLKLSVDQGDPWAAKTMETILKKSPLSLKVTLRQLIKGRYKSLKECLEMEFNMAMNFIQSDDFYEGVRSVLVDKGQNPIWKFRELEQISEKHIEPFFDTKHQILIL
jgi:enoyl-CoA hydratase/carnithine racemase